MYTVRIRRDKVKSLQEVLEAYMEMPLRVLPPSTSIWKQYLHYFLLWASKASDNTSVEAHTLLSDAPSWTELFVFY